MSKETVDEQTENLFLDGNYYLIVLLRSYKDICTGSFLIPVAKYLSIAPKFRAFVTF